jgi:hypothetical protein
MAEDNNLLNMISTGKQIKQLLKEGNQLVPGSRLWDLSLFFINISSLLREPFLPVLAQLHQKPSFLARNILLY